jgi:hypothetical protein
LQSKGSNETSLDAHRVFAARADDIPPGTGLPRGTQEQAIAARRRPWRRRTWVLAVAVAAGSVTAAVLTASASEAPSPLAAVTGALAKTAAASYSYTLDERIQVSGRDIRSIVVSGAFDRGHGIGTELLTTRVAARPVRAQIRFIGKYVYTWLSPGSGFGTKGPPWNKAPIPPVGSADGTPADDFYGFVTDRPVSPAELSGVLQFAGMVRDRGAAFGPGWSGSKYTFTAHLHGGRESVSATVYVDRHCRVRRLLTITTQGRRTTDRNLVFSDFGAPVPVTTPVAAQIQYTSSPYWGFFF